MKNPSKATVFAWIHTHVNGSKCFLSSIDLHTQFVYEKYFPHILAIVIELGQLVKKDIKFYQLSRRGTRRINQCNNTVNTPSIFHEECANDETFFNNLTEEIIYLDQATFEVIDVREKIESNNVSQIRILPKKIGKIFFNLFIMISSWNH